VGKSREITVLLGLPSLSSFHKRERGARRLSSSVGRCKGACKNRCKIFKFSIHTSAYSHLGMPEIWMAERRLGSYLATTCAPGLSIHPLLSAKPAKSPPPGPVRLAPPCKLRERSRCLTHPPASPLSPRMRTWPHKRHHDARITKGRNQCHKTQKPDQGWWGVDLMIFTLAGPACAVCWVTVSQTACGRVAGAHLWLCALWPPRPLFQWCSKAYHADITRLARGHIPGYPHLRPRCAHLFVHEGDETPCTSSTVRTMTFTRGVNPHLIRRINAACPS
jgi:hypothetical protein